MLSEIACLELSIALWFAHIAVRGRSQCARWVQPI